MTSELDRFKTILATLCIREPELTLGEALLVACEVEEEMKGLPLEAVANWTPDWDDPREIARWVKTQPSVTKHMPGKRIDAIKALRACSPLGLKEAKDVIEIAFPLF